MDVAALEFPVAESFLSCQGEGQFVGVMMQFIRLAGCTVGKNFSVTEKSLFKVTNNYQHRCETWDGRGFCCDTNYDMHEKMTPKQMSDLCLKNGVKRLCLTGGEPLMHHETPSLVSYLAAHGIIVHIETSGTIPLTRLRMTGGMFGSVWIAVSPKFGYLEEEIRNHASELKLLIDADIDEKDLVRRFISKFVMIPIYIQPINDEHTLNMDNMRRCVELQQKYPSLRLSIQAHKIWGVR
jgi:7-carboxy-7-deazaguanine synthase